MTLSHSRFIPIQTLAATLLHLQDEYGSPLGCQQSSAALHACILAVYKQLQARIVQMMTLLNVSVRPAFNHLKCEMQKRAKMLL